MTSQTASPRLTPAFVEAVQYAAEKHGAQCSAEVVVAILVALAVLWATGSLGPVYRWLVVLRSHSISRS
jgi:hypothetical protein